MTLEDWDAVRECGGSGCCGRKQIVIDFLYLDLSVCERCQGTDSSLEDAVSEVSAVLTAAGYEIIVNKIKVTSEELAIQHRFLSSPTIRVNGADIMDEVSETRCCECGELCGDDVDCRVWHYGGEEFAAPPKGLIVDAILKAVYSKNEKSEREDYALPENLKVFFDGLQAKEEGS